MKKIAFVIERMNSPRGTERALSSVANVLADYYDITIITSSQENIPDYFPLNKKINRVDIAIRQSLKYNTIFYNRILRDYKKKLSVFLQANKFDVVVALSGLQFYFLHSIKDGSEKIAWFHFDFEISRLLHGKRKLPLKNLLLDLHTKRRILHAKRYAKMIVVSKWQEEIWNRHCNNVICIYNPISFHVKDKAKLINKKVIAVGSLTYEKGFDRLIDVWGEVYKKYPDWQLDIYGAGPLRSELQHQIDDKQLSCAVKLQGIADNIVKEYLDHSIFVLSSRSESFALVLAEASMCGLPLVAIRCNNSIIETLENNKNGYLIELKSGLDMKKFVDKICLLIESYSLRSKMGAYDEPIRKYMSENIIKEWRRLLG